MDNTILIWKYLLPAMKSSEELNQYVGGRIFPLLANADTNYPYITYLNNTLL